MMEQLANYGVLGLWTIFNVTTILYYRKREDEHEKNLLSVINNNTIALIKVEQTMRGCNARN